MMIVNETSCHSDRAHLAIDPIVRLGKFLLDRSRECHYLECRSGLIDIFQSPVSPRFRLCSSYVIWIEGRSVCQSENFTIVRIENDNRAGFGIRACDRSLNSLFGLVLN